MPFVNYAAFRSNPEIISHAETRTANQLLMIYLLSLILP
jgi:hypothetical protein